MYVCICNRVTDHQIRRAAENGVITFAHLRLELGVAGCCGRCEPHARAVHAEALDGALPARPSRVVVPGAVAA